MKFFFQKSWPKKLIRKLNIFKTKRAFNSKQKVFFHYFWRPPIKVDQTNFFVRWEPDFNNHVMPAIPIVQLSSFCCSYRCFAVFVSKLSNLFMSMFPCISIYFSFLEHLTGRVNLTKNVKAYPAIIYLLKINNRSSRKRCETCFT